jgi:hypothetical protein
VLREAGDEVSTTYLPPSVNPGVIALEEIGLGDKFENSDGFLIHGACSGYVLVDNR